MLRRLSEPFDSKMRSDALGVLLLVKESRARHHGPKFQPSRWAMLGKASRHPVIGRLLLLTLISGAAFTGIESTLGFWGQHRFGWGPRQIGVVFGVVGITNALAQWFLTGRLSKRFGEATMLGAGMALTVVATALLPFSAGLGAVAGLMSLLAFGQSVAFPNVSALISRNADSDRQGQVLGLNNATNALARVTGPLFSSWVFSALSINGPFWVGSVMVAPAIILALSAGRAVKRASILT